MALVEDRALAHKLDMSTVQQPMAVSPQRKPHLQHRQCSDTARVSGQESISDPQRAQSTAMETSAASPELPPRLTVYRRRPSGPTHQPVLSGKSTPIPFYAYTPGSRQQLGQVAAVSTPFRVHPFCSFQCMRYGSPSTACFIHLSAAVGQVCDPRNVHSNNSATLCVTS